MLAQCLSRRELRLSGKLAMVPIDKTLNERCGHISFDTDLVIDPLRSLLGVEVVAILKERFDGTVKVSMPCRRSQLMREPALATPTAKPSEHAIR